ncbi:MAG: ABC transporter substrate-binding protein [Hyphomicrobiaceae bacterium]
MERYLANVKTGFAVLAFGAAGAFYPLGAQAADPIKIGYVGGTSGACGGLTHSAVKAMKIALEEINAAGGAAGRKIEVIWRDSKTKPDEGAKQARDLILTEKVHFLTGVCSSSVFMAINPVAKQYGIPLISAISGTHKATIDFGHPNVYQTQPHTLMEGKALAEYAAKQGWNNIVTMGLDYEWGRTTVKVFTEELKKLKPDVKIAKRLWPRIGETNLTSYITAALAEKPDAIMAVMFGSGTNSMIKQGKSYGLLQRTKLLTFLSTESYMSLGKDIPDGVHGWARAPFYALTSDRAKKLIEKYRKANKDEYPNDWGMLAYDAMHIIAGGVTKAGGTDPAKFREALGSMSFDTVRGTLKMRTIDNTFNAPSFLGVTKMSSKYPFPTMADVAVIEDTLPSEDTVTALRKAAAK